MILLSFLLIVLFNYFLTRKIDFLRPVNFILIQFLLVCANIILTFEITSLISLLNNVTAFLLVQAFLAAGAAAFGFLYKKGQEADKGNFREVLRDFWGFARKNILLIAIFIFVFSAYLYLAHLSIIFPQNTSDSMYNWLSRIGHWLQQGSLKPYESFSIFGIIYPYNNSLLMMWSVLFTHTDHYVGTVQWCAALMLSLSIYGLAVLLRFSRTQAGFAALIFLTFPIVILQSGTAQNDILAACFLLIGLYFFVSGFQLSSRLHVLFSAISLALAVGTKQYVAFVIPGFALIFLYFLLQKTHPQRLKLGKDFVVFTIVAALFLGSYAYIQNMIYWRTPLGNMSDTGLVNTTSGSEMAQKLAFNAARLSTQFISCEGLPLPEQNTCLEIKGNFFRSIFSSPNFNLESNRYMLEPNCDLACFNYSQKYLLNEDSAWYGILSWILIIPSLLIAVILSFRKKDPLPFLIVLTAVFYFLITSVFKSGWDSYTGRYLILGVALVMPFTGYLLSTKTWINTVIVGVISFAALFILTYTILLNDSKPLLNQKMLLETWTWGKSNALIVAKIAYKTMPWFEDEKTVYDYDYENLKTYFNGGSKTPYHLVNTDVPDDANLGIISRPDFFPDYLFFGDNFTRKVFDLPNYKEPGYLQRNIDNNNINYLLVDPDVSVTVPSSFIMIDSSNSWAIYAKR
ncbi:MAG TPA: glycosyltransferase family 39 protein [Longilinea sp.]|nr:glycosyltransferase family 39 protein [Longilinea sp.]